MSEEKNKGGRPLFKVDETILRNLAARLYSNREIAAILGCSHELLSRRFAVLLNEAREKGKAKLRDLQWEAAEKGDTRMIVHMSKHHLGEIDKQQITVERMSNEEIARVVEARLASEETQQLPAATESEELDDSEGDE